MFINATSQAAAAAFGQQAHTAFLMHYLATTPTPLGQDFSMTFVDYPFPIS
jgi:hypothetical protein